MLGVADTPPRAVVGTKSFRDPVAMVPKLFSALGFRVDIEEVAHPNGRVLVLHIPSRPRGEAYPLDGAYWMRLGESLVPMSADRLRGIFAEGTVSNDAAADSVVEDHERTLATQLAKGLSPSVGMPRRCVYGWPYSAPSRIFDPNGLLAAVATSWMPSPGDLMPLLPDLYVPQALRKANGLAWREQQRGDFAVSVGIDGSVAIEWRMWEGTLRDFAWGTNGVALGSTIDLLIGALVFSHRLLRAVPERRPLRWVLALQSIQGRKIAYNGVNAQMRFYSPGGPTCSEHVVEVDGSVPVAVEPRSLVDATSKVVSQVDYFFGAPVDRKYVEERLNRALTFLTTNKLLDTEDARA